MHNEGVNASGNRSQKQEHKYILLTINKQKKQTNKVALVSGKSSQKPRQGHTDTTDGIRGGNMQQQSSQK